jgi:RHS repeat-associated protein
MDYFNGTAVLNSSGAVQERYTYSAFGVRRIMAADFSPRSTSSHAWDFGFQGQFRDVETGWYNYGFRFYLPLLGRWINRDPIAERGGVNLYTFVQNQTINALDLFGLSALPKDLDEPCTEVADKGNVKTITSVKTWSAAKEQPDWEAKGKNATKMELGFIQTGGKLVTGAAGKVTDLAVPSLYNSWKAKVRLEVSCCVCTPGSTSPEFRESDPLDEDVEPEGGGHFKLDLNSDEYVTMLVATIQNLQEIAKRKCSES